MREGWRGERAGRAKSRLGAPTKATPHSPARGDRQDAGAERKAEGSGARAAAATPGGLPPRFVASRPRTKAAEAAARGSELRDVRKACAMRSGPRSLSWARRRRRRPARTRKQEKGVLGLGGSSAVASRPARPALLWLAGPGSIIDAPEL